MSYDTQPMKRHVESGGGRGDVIEFPDRQPSGDSVRATIERYSAVLNEAELGRDEGDIAKGLREEAAALTVARKSAGAKTLGSP
jgi:hypothetical protein